MNESNIDAYRQLLFDTISDDGFNDLNAILDNVLSPVDDIVSEFGNVLTSCSEQFKRCKPS